MNEIDLTNVEECPYYLIYRVSLLITSALKKGLVSGGADTVKPAYVATLASLWSEDEKSDGGMKVNEIGKKAGLEPSTMTGLIDRMERDGLVCRSNDPNDRRAQLISLTETRREIKETVNRILNETLGNVFKGIPDNDIEHTKDTLRLVIDNFKKDSE